MTKEEMTIRINTIPRKKIELQRQKSYFENRCKFSEAAMLQKQIDKLDEEFGRLYHQFGGENEKI